MTNPTSSNLPLWNDRIVSSVVQMSNHDYGKGRQMTNEYEWVEKRDQCTRDFGAKDMVLGWVIYSVAVLFLIV